MSEIMERELGWDDVIEQDAPEYVTLPEGDYDFEVISYDKARHNGSEKLPPCNKAVIRIRIEAEQGISTINHNLFLHSRTESMLSAFFAGIGQKKKGEKLQMNWNMVPGSKGRAKIGVREYNGNTYNEIKKFYPKEYSPYQTGKF